MRPVRTALVATAVGLVVAACGGSTSGDDPAAGESASPPPTATSPEPDPSQEQPEPGPTSPGVAPVEPEPGVLVGVPESGVESGCIVMGEYLLMGGDPDVLLSGQQLRITGAIEKVHTTCQQGIPFRVDSATPADS